MTRIALAPLPEPASVRSSARILPSGVDIRDASAAPSAHPNGPRVQCGSGRATEAAPGFATRRGEDGMDEAKTGRNLLRGRLGGRAGKGLAGAALLWVAKWAVVVAFVFAGCGPIGPIPGGALGGELGPAVVRDWSFADEVENAQLETRPGDPHSVNTWWGAVDGRIRAIVISAS